MTVSKITQDAEQTVKDRDAEYGKPSKNLARTAGIWSAILADKLKEPLTDRDVARCMMGLKLSRLCTAYKRDSVVDFAGYATILERLEAGGEN